jgi:ribonucleoside-diphosphate reductase alpha chain
MARGLPYDSDEGRAYAAAITALMTGRAYRKSAEVARRMGAHAGYDENRAAMVGVIAKHRAAVGNIDHTESVPDDLLAARGAPGRRPSRSARCTASATRRRPCSRRPGRSAS